MHIKAIHKGETFPCPGCDYKATAKGNLQMHIKFCSRWKNNRQMHIKAIHKGEKFQCTDCDYKATAKGNLQMHIKTIHKGETFPRPE